LRFKLKNCLFALNGRLVKKIGNGLIEKLEVARFAIHFLNMLI